MGEYRPYLVPKETYSVILRKNVIFTELTRPFPFEPLSTEHSDHTLTYGEIQFISMAEIFETLKHRYSLQEHGVFYDLGSGMGKAVLAAALSSHFAVCRGIELLQRLHTASLQLKTLYDSSRTALAAQDPGLFRTLPELEFFCGDLLRQNWEDATCIFANSTCFSGQMMDAIASSAASPGTKAITFTKQLQGAWRLLEKVQKDMSWGLTTVFMYEHL